MRLPAKGLTALAVLMAYAPSCHGAERSAVRLRPSSAWVVDYADASCRLVRSFGEGDQRIVLGLTRYEPSNLFDLTVSGKPLKYGNVTVVPIWFGPSAKPMKGAGIPMTQDRLTAMFVPHFAMSASLSEQRAAIISGTDEASVTELTLALPDRPQLTLALGPMGAPMQALRACTDDLVANWGFDPKQQARLSKPAMPLGDSSKWLSEDDFPGELYTRRESAIVQYRLDVAADGSVSGCHVQDSTKLPGFAERTCKLLRQRARFSSALDEGKRPIASYFASRIEWRYVDGRFDGR